MSLDINKIYCQDCIEGMKAEIEYAPDNGMKIEFISSDDIFRGIYAKGQQV